MPDFIGAKNYIIKRLEEELNLNLYYHGIHHTLDVYGASIKIAEKENLSEEETIIVNTAALYHDSGFLYTYEQNEERAVELINEVLPGYGYTMEQITLIGRIILTTRLKDTPTTLLEKVMSDSDYDYLGRGDVGKVAETLHRELTAYGFYYSEEEWIDAQIKFLEKHEYYTISSIISRNPKKLEYLNYLKALKIKQT